MLPYELRFEFRENYLYAHIKAEEIDAETASAYLREIANKCASRWYTKALLVRDIAGMLSTADLFFVVDDFARMMKGRRVAFLNLHSNVDDFLEFGMVVAQNRKADFKLHRSLDDAEKWLASG